MRDLAGARGSCPSWQACPQSTRTLQTRATCASQRCIEQLACSGFNPKPWRHEKGGLPAKTGTSSKQIHRALWLHTLQDGTTTAKSE